MVLKEMSMKLIRDRKIAELIPVGSSQQNILDLLFDIAEGVVPVEFVELLHEDGVSADEQDRYCVTFEGTTAVLQWVPENGCFLALYAESYGETVDPRPFGPMLYTSDELQKYLVAVDTASHFLDYLE